MSNEKLFSETSPTGHEVSLTKNRYDIHIVGESGHTEVLPKDIQRAVSSPIVVYQSSVSSSRDVYFAKSSSVYPKLYVKVAVEVDDKAKTGEVVTSFLTKEISGGIKKGVGPKYVSFNNKL